MIGTQRDEPAQGSSRAASDTRSRESADQPRAKRPAPAATAQIRARGLAAGTETRQTSVWECEKAAQHGVRRQRHPRQKKVAANAAPSELSRVSREGGMAEHLRAAPTRRSGVHGPAETRAAHPAKAQQAP